MTTTTIQPSEIDTTIRAANPTVNYGTSTVLQIGVTSGYPYRTLIKWDLSGIPSSEICDSATLSLWLDVDAAPTYAITFGVYRILRNWGETTVTWNKYDGTNNWTTAGASGAGDMDATLLGESASISQTTPVGTEIQISLSTAEIQKMYDGTYTNYGFVIKSMREDLGSRWDSCSREHATTGNRPKLVVVTHSSGVATFIPGAIWF